MAELKADPVFQAAQAERDKAHFEKVTQLKVASKPLDDALRRVCPLVKQGVWDLVNTCERYDEALPILFEHLTKDYRMKFWMALRVPWPCRKPCLIGLSSLVCFYASLQFQRDSGMV